MTHTVPGLPGIKSDREALLRVVRKSGANVAYAPKPLVIDGAESRDLTNTGNTDVLQSGTLMGKITSGGKYAPSIIGLTAALHDTSAVTTTMTLPAAVITEIARRVGQSGNITIIGPATTGGTVNTETVAFSAIASSTTLTISATTNDYVAGSIIAAADGSQIPRVIIDDGYGIKVTDEDGNNIDVPFEHPLVAGVIDSSQIVNWSSESAVQEWIKDTLNDNGAFVFDDEL